MQVFYSTDIKVHRLKSLHNFDQNFHVKNTANKLYLKASILKETQVNAKVSVTHYSPREERTLCFVTDKPLQLV